MKNRNNITVPGKIILSGEHAVVYGYPAIAAATNLRLTIGKDGKVSSDIPIGAGMGSSAAFAVAKSAFKIGKLDLEKINSLAYEMEKKQHGNPSGVDNTIVTYGGFLWYRKESENFKTFKQIKSKAKLSKLFLLNSGKPAESTREMVEYVGNFRFDKRTFVDGLFKEIEIVTRGFLKFLLGKSKEDFGKLIKENEKLLEKLGVVSEGAKRVIRKIEKMGGYAKISGAGGKKDGSGMVLVYHRDVENITLFAKQNNLNLMSVKLGGEGVKFEK